MAESMDETTLSTLTLLESRLQRIEHLLYGRKASPSLTDDESALRRLNVLERRFATLLSDFRVYGELLKIYNAHPDFFHAPEPAQPPSQLSPDAIQAIVLASASSFPATLSALTAIKDCPIPDASESAALVALTERMRAVEATQLAQAAEVAELRGRSETVLRAWYEGGMLRPSQFMADAEGRVEKLERGVRRREREMELQKESV